MNLLKLIDPCVAKRIRNKETYGLYLCACGNKKVIINYDVKSGHTKSCGCLKSISTTKKNTTHNKRYFKEYVIWCNIKSRCYNSSNKDFKNYGGRGIKMCDRWLTSFDNFYADIAPRPSNKHSLDRINNDLGYSPENCRWATKKEQNNNRRDNKLINYMSLNKTISEWAAEYKLQYDTLYRRLYIFKWDVKKAITKSTKKGT